MGRMADARKKAKQQKGGGDESDGTAETPSAPAPRPPVSSEDVPPPRWVSSEETISFPAESHPPSPAGPVSSEPDDMEDAESAPPSSGSNRIALPSSGLASDILSREDAMSLQPTSSATSGRVPEPTAMAPAAPPLTPGARPQSSLFGTQGRDDRKAAPELMEHLVTFYLSDEEYGLDVRVVQEIIRVTETTHVPRAPTFIKGVINLRGRIIPVVDLKRKLELGEVAESRLARIVVVKLRDRLIGLLVDGASQVLKIPVSSIDQAPEEILDVNMSFIRSVAKLDNRLIILLDLYKILSMEIEHAIAQ